MKKKEVLATFVLVLGIILLVLLVIFVAFSFRLPKQYPQEYSQKIIDLCEKERNLGCDPDCVDGFLEEGYFDSRKYSKEDLSSGWTLSERAREACFAIHASSVCGKCFSRFQLKVDGEFKEVSCEEFFQTIEDENQSCNDCVEKIWSGCC